MSVVKRTSTGGGVGPVGKRNKIDGDDEVPSSFLRDLEQMDTDIDLAPADLREKWSRPPVPRINPATDSLCFQQLEIDHYIGDPMAGMPGYWRFPSHTDLNTYIYTHTYTHIHTHTHIYIYIYIYIYIMYIT